MEFFEVHDEETNKTLLIKAGDLEQAIGIADTLPFDQYNDGQEIDVIDDIENYIE